MGTPQDHQKTIFYTPKVKKNKDTYGIYPTKFASSTQKISNKSMFRTSKVKRRQKFVWGLPDGVACRLNPKS
jgi:hypothetical protein